MAKLIQGQKYTLSGSGVTSSQTTIPLNSFNLPDGTAIASGDLATTNYGTLEPGTSREEIISFTGISGTTLTGVVRGLKFVSPFTTDATLQNSHAGNSIFVLTNNPQVYQDFITDDNPIAESAYTPSADANLTTKSYVDNRDGYWDGAVDDVNALPIGAIEGEARVTLDEGKIYVWDIAIADTATISSVDTATDIITTSSAHGLSTGEYIYLYTTGTLPLGLAIDTPYYVYVDSTTTMHLSLTKAGATVDITGAVTDTDTMKEASWVLAGAGGGAGTVYVTTKLGSQSEGGDFKTFELTTGSFTSDVFLQVYVNGVLMENGASEDYVTSGTNRAIFNTVVESTDKITLLVVSVDLYNPEWNNVTADILPDTTNTHDIGSDTLRFKDAYLEGNVDIDGTLNVEGVATLADASTLATSAAPTADAEIANKKYVDDAEGVSTIFNDYTEHNQSNSTSEFTILTATIPANTLGTTGGIEWKVYVNASNSNSGGFLFKVYYGTAGSPTEVISAQSMTTGNQNMDGVISGIILAAGSTSSQVANMSLHFGKYEADTGQEFNPMLVGGQPGTCTEDSTVDLEFKVTMTAGGASGDIFSRFGYIKKL